VPKRILAGTRRRPTPQLTDAIIQPVMVRPSTAPKVPEGLGASTFAAMERVRQHAEELVGVGRDVEGFDYAEATGETVTFFEALEALEREVTRLVAAAGQAAERVRRREHLEDYATRTEALWALRRGRGRQEPTTPSS
jgi:hypothetical protein